MSTKAMTSEGKAVLVTGANRGIGQATKELEREFAAFVAAA